MGKNDLFSKLPADTHLPVLSKLFTSYVMSVNSSLSVSDDFLCYAAAAAAAMFQVDVLMFFITYPMELEC